MEDCMDDDYDWSTPIAPSSAKYSKMGSPPHLSNTIKPAEDRPDDDLKSLSTKVQVLQEKEDICDSELPPGLAEDILSLSEDYPQKEMDLKKLKTFKTEENIGSEGQLYSHLRELDASFTDTNIQNKPVPHAVGEKGLQASSDERLKEYFARQGKRLMSINDKGSHEADIVTASELQRAVAELGIGGPLLFWRPSSCHSKLSKPLNTEINGDETLDNQSGNSKFSFLPSHKSAPKQSTVPLPANTSPAASKPVKEIKVTNKQIPGKCIEPEPPDPAVRSQTRPLRLC